jgi:DNA-directed RNA polymerase specialized sigma24 family protein
MQKAKQGVNMKLVQGVFRAQFRSSKSGFLSVVKWLSSITVGYARDAWSRRKRKNADGDSDEQMENFFEMHKSRFQELLKDLIASLQSGIVSLPKEHFDDLRNRLFEELRKLDESVLATETQSRREI